MKRFSVVMVVLAIAVLVPALVAANQLMLGSDGPAIGLSPLQSSDDAFGLDLNRNITVGSGFFMFGRIKHNDDGEIVSIRGFNPFYLGWYRRYYFSPVTEGKFNLFWHWGTVVFIAPYAGIGGDFLMKNGWYIEIGTLYVMPYIAIGKFY